MDSFLVEESEGGQKSEAEFFLGTVKTWSSNNGVQITLDGESEPMQKRYKMLYVCRPLPVGARVLVMKMSGTFIVLGEFGAPIGFYRPDTLSSNASLADVINVVNVILSALRSQGLVWNPQ